MVRTANLDVSGLHCPICIGFVLDALIEVPGVTRVTVGAMHAGHSLVAVTSSATVAPELVSEALHGAGFDVCPEEESSSANPADRSER